VQPVHAVPIPPFQVGLLLTVFHVQLVNIKIRLVAVNVTTVHKGLLQLELVLSHVHLVLLVPTAHKWVVELHAVNNVLLVHSKPYLARLNVSYAQLVLLQQVLVL
jgi:hypothetical protein